MTRAHLSLSEVAKMGRLGTIKLKATKCEMIAIVGMILFTFVFPVLLFYIIPLLVVDLVGPQLVENHFASNK